LRGTVPLVLFTKAGLSQQLRLGNSPWTVERSAVLELESANQGLLFSRIADTTTGVLSVNGNAGALTMDTTYISNFYLKVRGLFSAGTGISYNSTTGVITTTGSAASAWAYNGNTVGSIKTLGTIDTYDLPFLTSNTEKMRISGATVNGTLMINPGSALPAGIAIAWSRVSLANTITIAFTNSNALGTSVGNITYDVTVIQ